jgi:RES domain-containing protein
MDVWRLQHRKYPLVNSEGARRTGGRWNLEGSPVIYTSESPTLAALEVMVHHGGIPEDYVAIRISIPEGLLIACLDLDEGWTDLMPIDATALQGSEWVRSGQSAILRVPSATMSSSGFNYIINPNHPDFPKLEFAFVELRFDDRLRPRIGLRAS